MMKMWRFNLIRDGGGGGGGGYIYLPLRIKSEPQ